MSSVNPLISSVNVPNHLPSITAQQARDIATNTSRASLWFVLGSLLGLVASMIGASVGTRKARTYS